MARRVELREVVRSYGGAAGTAGVLAWANDARAQLDAMDDSAEGLAALDRQCAQARSAAASAAIELSTLRQDAAAVFQDAITAELKQLAMASVRIAVHIAHRDAAWGKPVLEVDGREVGAASDGIDTITIEMSNDAGSTYRPIAKGASGGELSRVMLATEVVLAGADPLPTMVFDEVDSGVGGEAAIEIGRRLAKLGQDHQVIAVTHLPQVAAYADRHVVIEKSSAGAVTRSDIRHLDEQQRVVELTRMLAGLTDSDSGRAHAAELLESASHDKSEFGSGPRIKRAAPKRSTSTTRAAAKKSVPKRVAE